MCIKIKKIPNIPCHACLHNDCTYLALFFFLVLCFGGFSPLQNNPYRLQKSIFQISIFKKSPMQRKDSVPYKRIPNNICRYTPPSRRWGLTLPFLKVNQTQWLFSRVWKGENSNFVAENPGRHYLNLVVRVHFPSDVYP